MKLPFRLPFLVGLLACASLPGLQAKDLLPQKISSFSRISPQAFPEATFQLEDAPTSSSGLPVTIAVQSGPAVIVKVGTHYRITTTGTGVVGLVATQPGNRIYAPAKAVTTHFAVKLEQKIFMTQPPPYVITNAGSQLYNVKVRASSGLPVDLSVQSGNASMVGQTVVIYGAGTIVLEAKQEGNAIYAPATPVTKSFVVQSKIPRTGPGGG